MHMNNFIGSINFLFLWTRFYLSGKYDYHRNYMDYSKWIYTIKSHLQPQEVTTTFANSKPILLRRLIEFDNAIAVDGKEYAITSTKHRCYLLLLFAEPVCNASLQTITEKNLL